jgi:hypothetical protein
MDISGFLSEFKDEDWDGRPSRDLVRRVRSLVGVQRKVVKSRKGLYSHEECDIVIREVNRFRLVFLI